MAEWLSWLERRPVTAKVESSSLFWVVSNLLTKLIASKEYGIMYAQLGEHLPYKQRVIGSSPSRLRWLERRPVTAKVESSSLFWVVSNELIECKLHMDMES